MDIVAVDQRTPQKIAESFNVLLDKFLASQDIKDKSKETYRKGLGHFFSFIRDMVPATLSRETILEYKDTLREKKLTAYTINTYLSAVRKFFEWTESIKAFPNIARGVKGARRPEGYRKDALTVEQVKKILNSMDRTTTQGKRDFALVNLLIRTGLRAIEVQRALVDDIRQTAGEALLYIQSKGRDSKDAFVLLTDETISPIREYLTERKVSPVSPLFASISDRNREEMLTTRSVSRIVKTALRGVGLDDSRLTAHSLRHTAVTLSLKGGATLQEAQVFARHKDINTTLIYAHNIDRIGQAPERKIASLLANVG